MKPTPEDQQLLRAFHEEGAQEAFEALVLRHQAMVHGVCRRILREEEAAREATQATFLALALKAKRIDARQGLGGWLHRVARQVSYDLLRSNLRRQQREAEAGRRALLEKDEKPAAQGELIDEAIAALSPKLRAAVIGHYLEGCTLEELARRHQCSPSAISMRLSRAREHLRHRLGTTLPTHETLSRPLPASAALATWEVIRMALHGVHAAQAPISRVLALAQQTLQTLFLQRLRHFALGAGAAALLTLSLSRLTSEAIAQPPAAPSVPTSTTVTTVPPPTPALTPETAPIEEPPFIYAIRTGHFPWEKAPQFRRLLEAQRQPFDTIRDANGDTPLHWCVRRNWPDYALLLMLKGAGVNVTNHAGETPLFDAIRTGHYGLQRLLLMAGADVNHSAGDGKTPLQVAIAKGDSKSVEGLLWLGAKVDPSQTSSGNPAAEIAFLLEAYSANPTPSPPRQLPHFVKNSLHEAARVADLEKLETFLDQGANINLRDEAGRTPLHRAISAGWDEVVYYLLVLGADPNLADRQGVTPLMSTMGWLGASFDEMRFYLILSKASPFSKRLNGHTELTSAVHADNSHGTQWLLWLGANGWEKTRHGTPFQVAYHAGRQRIIDLLRRNGIDEPFEPIDDPVWKLHNAARRGDEAALLEALKGEVSIDAPDAEGHSPLIIAIATRNLNIARLLLERGATLEYRNAKNGVTPLWMTCIWDYAEMTSFRLELLEAGADPNAANAKGETPLMRSLWHHPTTPLKQLLEHGADPLRKNAAGLNAIEQAHRDGKRETARFLEQWLEQP